MLERESESDGEDGLGFPRTWGRKGSCRCRTWAAASMAACRGGLRAGCQSWPGVHVSIMCAVDARGLGGEEADQSMGTHSSYQCGLHGVWCLALSRTGRGERGCGLAQQYSSNNALLLPVLYCTRTSSMVSRKSTRFGKFRHAVAYSSVQYTVQYSTVQYCPYLLYLAIDPASASAPVPSLSKAYAIIK